MKFSESLKKNKDFQVVYKMGNPMPTDIWYCISENGMDKNRLRDFSQ